jgi:hypothetical protein
MRDLDKIFVGLIILIFFFTTSTLIYEANQIGNIKREINSLPHKYCHNESNGLVCSVETPYKMVYSIDNMSAKLDCEVDYKEICIIK